MLQRHDYRIRFTVPTTWCTRLERELTHVELRIGSAPTGFSLPARVRRVKPKRTRAKVWIDVTLEYSGTDSPGEAWDVFLHDVVRPPGSTKTPRFWLPREIVRRCRGG